MLRITKLTDYGILILTLLADLPAGEQVSARDLALETSLPLPTVGKLLRILTKAGLLTSQRGVTGGYRLAHSSEDTSVLDIIQAFEGPIALTDCLSAEAPDCEVEAVCPTRANWDRINGAVRTALAKIPLAAMARPQDGWRRRISASLLADSGHTGKVGS